jgi:hypothetical protein
MGNMHQQILHLLEKQYEIAKNGEKTGGFAHVFAYKSLKTPFFALKYLTRFTHETFFEEYTNFEAHYLSRCRDIPLQSFGSHIRLQLHGLGLNKVKLGIESDNFMLIKNFKRTTVTKLSQLSFFLHNFSFKPFLF